MHKKKFRILNRKKNYLMKNYLTKIFLRNFFFNFLMTKYFKVYRKLEKFFIEKKKKKKL